MTGSFTGNGTIQIIIPVGTIITPVAGGTWDGIIHIPTSGSYSMLDSSTTVQ